jgi:hypothetical protein
MSIGMKAQLVRAIGTVVAFGALGLAATTTLSPKAKAGEYLGRIGSNPFCSDCTANPFAPISNPFNPNSPRNPFGKYGNPFSPYSANNPFATNTPEVYGTGDDEE